MSCRIKLKSFIIYIIFPESFVGYPFLYILGFGVIHVSLCRREDSTGMGSVGVVTDFMFQCKYVPSRLSLLGSVKNGLRRNTNRQLMCRTSWKEGWT